MILIVGATGTLGMEVCRRLATEGRAVRALVRETSDSSKKQQLHDWGATLATGDLRDSRSLMEACRGATAIISTATSTISHQSGDSIETVDRDGQLNLIDAARANAVERFIFVSFRHNAQNPFPLSDAKQAVEQALRAFNYTILQASFFMEVWLTPMLGFDFPNATARVYGSGENKISWISLRDVAEFCVTALENPAAERAVLEIGGPEPLSPLAVVRIFERASGRNFQIEHVPVETLEAQMRSAANSLEKTFAGLMLGYARGDAIDMRSVLEKFPLSLTSVHDYARRVLRASAAAG